MLASVPWSCWPWPSGSGGFYFVRTVDAQANLEAAALEMDTMADEIGTLQNEILVYGLKTDSGPGNGRRSGQDWRRQEGHRQPADLELDASASAVADLEKNLSKFKESFADFSAKLSTVTAGKAKLAEIGDKAEKKLTDIIARHKSELAPTAANRFQSHLARAADGIGREAG